MSADAAERLEGEAVERPRDELAGLPDGLVCGRRLTGGSGTFGDVFEADDRRFNAQHPVKRVVRVLAAKQLDHLGANRAAFAERLSMLLELEAPHVGSLLEAGKFGDGLYLVGNRHEKSLAVFLEEKGGTLSTDEAIAIIEQIARALAEFHAQEVVHGDVRPENIFIKCGGTDGEQGFTAWLEDAATGRLPYFTGNALFPPGGHRYRRDAPEPGGKAADLYALGVTACELVLGRDKVDGQSANDLRKRLAAKLRQTSAWGGLWLSGTNRRYLKLVSLLFHREALRPNDARQVARDYDDWKRRRKRLKRIARAFLFVTLVLLGCGALALSFAYQRRGEELQTINAQLSQQGRAATDLNDMIEAKDKEIQTLRSGNQQTVELERQLAAERKKTDDASIERAHLRADVQGREREIQELQAELDMLRRPGPRTVAEREWQKLFTDKTKYDASQAARLLTSQGKTNRAVADATKRHIGNIQDLLVYTTPWLAADEELKKLHEAAFRHDWRSFDEVDAAADRLRALRAAADKWDRNLKDAGGLAGFKQKIEFETDARIAPILKGWYAAFLKTHWTIELLRGHAERGSKNAQQVNHVVTIKNSGSGQKAETPVHQWVARPPDASSTIEAEYDYRRNKTELLRIDWQPGEPIELLLYGDWTTWKVGARWNLIDEEITGPLAMYDLHRQGKIGADGSTIEFRVLDCPGPPRGWSALAAARRDAIKKAEKLIGAK